MIKFQSLLLSFLLNNPQIFSIIHNYRWLAQIQITNRYYYNDLLLYRFKVLLTQSIILQLNIRAQNIKNMESKIAKILYFEPVEKDIEREVFQMVARNRLNFYALLLQRNEQLQKLIINQDEIQIRKDWKNLFNQLPKDEKDFNFYLIDFETTINEGRCSLQQIRDRDNFSHYICRLMYCADQNKQQQFYNLEQTTLKLRLAEVKNKQAAIERARKVSKKSFSYTKSIYFQTIKLLEAKVFQTDLIEILSYDEFTQEQSIGTERRISKATKIFAGLKFKESNDIDDLKHTDIFKVPLKYCANIINRRQCFIQKGWAYVDFNLLREIIPKLYQKYLRRQLEQLSKNYSKILLQDVDNQFKSFIKQGPNLVITGEVSIQDLKEKLNLKNLSALSKRSFPPCMLNLLHTLENTKHLKHEGRRQLMLFLKVAGFTIQQSQQFWKKNLTKGVSESDAKQHQYNVRHSYGREGKKVDYTPKICSSIINDKAPGSGEHHGCTFKHFGKEEVRTFLKSKYLGLTASDLDEIVEKKQGNHFQLACKTLFTKTHPDPDNKYNDITMRVGNTPNMYFYCSQKYYQAKRTVKKQKQEQ